MGADFLPDVIRPENRKVPQRALEGRLAISRRYTSGAKSVWNGVFPPDVTRPENREGQNGKGKRRNGKWKQRNGEGKSNTGKGSGETGSGRATQTSLKDHRGAGIALFKIVLGLMCPGRLSGGGESQNEAKSRRFGMDMPCRAFYEGVNPKTIWNHASLQIVL